MLSLFLILKLVAVGCFPVNIAKFLRTNFFYRTPSAFVDRLEIPCNALVSLCEFSPSNSIKIFSFAIVQLNSVILLLFNLTAQCRS